MIQKSYQFMSLFMPDILQLFKQLCVKYPCVIECF